MNPHPEISFDAASHTYAHIPTGRALLSVTTALRMIKPPFDREGISLRMAAKTGRSQEEILAEWEANSISAMNKGQAVHAYAEDVLSELNTPVEEAGNRTILEMAAFKRAWGEMQNDLKAEVMANEMTVGCPELGVAGRVDRVARLTFGDKPTLHIFDWKTGKRFNSTNNFGERLLPPFHDLDNCELQIYSLQTSIYRLLIERTFGKLGDAFLVHLANDGSYRFIRARDHRARCEQWLKSINK